MAAPANQNEPMGVCWPVLMLLVAATVLVTWVSCLLARAPSDFPGPAFLLLVAVACAEANLLGLSFGLGAAPLHHRVSILIGGIAALVWLGWLTVGASPSDSAPFLVCQAVSTVLLSAAGRRTGFRWRTVAGLRAEADTTIARHQFTLRRLFLWTTVAVMLAALFRAISAAGLTWGDLLLVAMFLLGNTAVSLMGAWTVSTPHNRPFRLATLILGTVGLGILWGPWAEAPSAVAFYVIEALLVAGWIAAARAGGLPIGRLRTE